MDRFCIIDVEGSGGSPPEIVELAMVEIRGLTLTESRRRWLIRPERGIESSTTRIHGLTEADLIGAPAIEDIAQDVLEWFEDAPIVGHNVRVELDIISRLIDDWSPPGAIDTLRLAKKLRPGLASYGLANLGEELGLSIRAAERTGRAHHSALYDATLTAMIFIDLLAPLTGERRAWAISEADILDPKQGSLL